MQRFRLLALLIALAGLTAYDPGPKLTPTSAGPIALPGERPANPALATPPDEWARPTQTAQARR
jgi:hypothetical protein